MSTGRAFVLCFAFSVSTLRRQPWHVAHGLAEGLAANGFAVTLVTDVAEPAQPAAYELRAVPRLLERGRPSAALATLIHELAPDRLYFVTGASAIAQLRAWRLKVPFYLVMASPLLHLRELMTPGIVALWRERAFAFRPLVNALLPGLLVVAGFKRSGARGLVYLSEATRRRAIAIGLPRGPLLRPQVAPPAQLVVDAAGETGDRVTTVAYLGPPLALRGAYTALAAFEAALGCGLTARLLLLLRPDVPKALLNSFLARVETSPCRAAINVTTRMLEPAELASVTARVDAFLLPFAAPVSEVPLVVIEAGLTGRPVITTDAPGVGEQARVLGGLVVRDPADLPHALLRALRGRRPVAVDPGPWTSWPRAVREMLDDPVPPAWRLVALCGVDGVGKSFLAQRLRHRLDAVGIPSRHVWSRFRNYLSKPLLALARLTGHNRKVEVEGVRIGYHDFQGRAWLAWPFLVLQAADQMLDMTLRYRPAGRVLVVGDRCVADTLVDLAVDTGLDDFIVERLGPMLLRFLPQPALLIVIERHPLRIQAQRPDALFDRHFHRRRLLYRRIAEQHGLAIVDNDGTPAAALDAIDRLIGQSAAVAQPLRGGEERDLRLLQ